VGLVTQSWGGWAVDVVKGTAISAGIAAGGGAILVLALERFGLPLIIRPAFTLGGRGGGRWEGLHLGMPGTRRLRARL